MAPLLLKLAGVLDWDVVPLVGRGLASGNWPGDSILPVRPKVISPRTLECGGSPSKTRGRNDQ